MFKDYLDELQLERVKRHSYPFDQQIFQALEPEDYPACV
jgi:hypothetical protein